MNTSFYLSRLLRPALLLSALLGIAGIMQAAPQETRAQGYTFPRNIHNWDERITIEALQGIMNRDKPRLFLTESWTPYNAMWTDVYAKEYGIDFEPIGNIVTLINKFKGEVDGIVLYDPQIDATRYIAATLAGLDNLLPIANNTKWLDKVDLPVKVDLTNRFANSIEAYEWALQEVFPRCNKKVAHTPASEKVDGKYIGWGFHGLDYVIAEKGMIWNLGIVDKDSDSFGRNIEGTPDQAKLYHRFLDQLERPALLFGYGEPELDWFALVGEYGHTYLHWGDNMSFHSRVEAKNPEFRQKVHFTPENVQVEDDKYYVAFVSSEGDTMKGPQPFFFGSWFDPQRGTVPMNWCIHPEMVRFPAMLEYFYDSATPNDYFVAMQVFNFNIQDMDGFAHHVGNLMKEGDLSVVIGDFSEPSKYPEKKERFLNIVNPLGVFDALYFQPDVQGSNYYIGENDIPVAASARKLAYWHRLLPGGWHGNPRWQDMYANPEQRDQVFEVVLKEIEKEAAAHKPPYLIIVYTDQHEFDKHPEMHNEISNRLDSDRFKVVRLDEGLSVLRKAREAKR